MNFDSNVVSLEDLEEAESCCIEQSSSVSLLKDYVVENSIVTKIFHDYGVLKLPKEVKGINADAVSGYCIKELHCWFVPSSEFLYQLSYSVLDRLGSGDCSGEVYRLYSVVLSNPSIELQDYSFMEHLGSLSIAERNPYYKTVDGVLFSKDGTVLLKYPSWRKETEYRIPDGVERICSFAFRLCHYLESLCIADSVRVLEPACISNCSSLKTLRLPDSMEHFPIGCDADNFPFLSLNNVSVLRLPDGMKFLQDGCLTALTVREIVLNEGLLFIGNNVFPNTLKGRLVLPRSLLYVYPNRLYGVKEVIAPYRIPGFSDSLLTPGFITPELYFTVVVQDQDSVLVRDGVDGETCVKENANKFLMFNWKFYANNSYRKALFDLYGLQSYLRRFWESDYLDYDIYNEYVKLSLSGIRVPTEEQYSVFIDVFLEKCYVPDYLVSLCNSIGFIEYSLQFGQELSLFKELLNTGLFSMRILRKFLRVARELKVDGVSLAVPLVLDALAACEESSLTL